MYLKRAAHGRRGLFRGELCLLVAMIAGTQTPLSAAPPPEVWAGDAGNSWRQGGGITRYSFSGTNLGTVSGSTRTDALAVVGGEVWAGDAGNSWRQGGQIKRYDFTGNLITSFGGRTDAIQVVGGVVWAGDAGNSWRQGGQITKYSFAGANLGAFGSRTDALLIVGGEVWAGDAGNSWRQGGTIRWYDFSGNLQGNFGGRTDALAIVNGEVWAGDAGNSWNQGGTITRYNFSHTQTGTLGGRTNALAVPGTEVWAGDAGNSWSQGGGITRFNFAGGNLGTLGARTEALVVVQVLDCNTNNINDGTDINGVTSEDCNTNTIPDECDLAAMTSLDCNSNSIPDKCDILSTFSKDCNTNTVPDNCDLAFGPSPDCNTDNIPDECDILHATSADCNTSQIPDECDILGATSRDCNSNGIADECESGSGDILWSGADASSFTTDANWVGGITPSTAGNAILTNTGASDNRAIFDWAGTRTICDLSINATGSGRQILQINAGSTFDTNDFVSVATGGDIDLQGGSVSGGTVTNTSNSITGFGEIAAPLVNEGLIEVTIAKRMTMTGPSFANGLSGRLSIPFASFTEVLSPTFTQAGDVELHALAGLSTYNALINDAGGNITLLDGSLHAANLTNAAGATIYGFGTIDCGVTNEGDILVITNTQIIGDLINNGTVVVQGGIVTITGSLSGSGTIIGGFGGRGGSCGGLVINGSYILGENSTLSLGCGTLKLGGNFDVAINDHERFDMTIATLQMAGLSGTQLLETLADDAGTCPTLPDSTLFSIGTLRIGPTPTTVKLVDAHVNSVGGSSSPEVLYVRQLTIESGARLDLGGKTLYYVTSTPVNPTPRVIDSVGGGQLIQLSGGGALRGDLNGDCTVDLADVPLFIQVLLGLDTTPAHVTAADVDRNGVDDGRDVAAMAQLLIRP